MRGWLTRGELKSDGGRDGARPYPHLRIGCECDADRSGRQPEDWGLLFTRQTGTASIDRRLTVKNRVY